MFTTRQPVLGRAGQVHQPAIGELALREELELVVQLLVSSGDVDDHGDCHCGILSLAEIFG